MSRTKQVNDTLERVKRQIESRSTRGKQHIKKGIVKGVNRYL